MPYFVYHVKPFGQIKALGEHASFALASQQAKQLRAEMALPVGEKVKVIFAEDAWTAEDLLCQVREAPPAGDD
ncbi:MAG: hypothetical protein Fur007_08040 [Rhodoferax sp.]